MRRNRWRRDAQAAQRNRRGAARIVAAMVGAYLLFMALFGDFGLVHYLRALQLRAELHAENARLVRENGELERRVDALRSDPAMIERLARERLGLAREGDRIYEWPVEPKASNKIEPKASNNKEQP